MKLYSAGFYAANFEKGSTAYNKLDEGEKAMRDSAVNMLESYWYIKSKSCVNRIRARGDKVFLDSGAFSAFTKGASIDVNTYVNYVKENYDLIEEVDGVKLVSVLDSIGNDYLTYCNQVAMENLGVKPLPCFHYGEDERYLQYYVENYPYITLGGMAIVHSKQLIIWLDRIWDKYLTNPDGTAKIKVHGFAITTPSLMKRYPWYSVDSSSWVRIGMTGSIILRSQKVIAISKTSPNRKDEWQHIDTIPSIMREELERALATYNVKLDRLQTIQYARWAFNAGIFSLIEKDCTVDRIARKDIGFF